MAYHIDQLQPGMSASTAKTVTEADIILFAGISTDVNPAHLDEEYAKGTMFGGRIAHGMLSAGFISAVLANKLPGPGTIYLSQTLKSTLVSKKYLENVFDSVGDILIIMDQDLKIRRINQYTRLFLLKPCDDIIGQPLATLFDSSFPQSAIQEKLRDAPHLEHLEGTMKKGDGQKTSVIASISTFWGEDQVVNGYILNAKDISKTKLLLKKLEESNLILKKQESILLEQSNTDALTGACNRGCIFSILEDIHANTPLLYTTFTVIMIDLDHFKSVNDRFGHQAGDEVLVETVRIIRDNLRKTDFLGAMAVKSF